MDVAETRLRFEQCEERRERVLRGDGAIGILPVAEIEQMVATYHELGGSGMAEAWVGLAQYHLDPNGLEPSLELAVRYACRAVVLGSGDGLALLEGILPPFRGEGFPDPPEAEAVAPVVTSALADDPTGRAHRLAGLLTFHGFGRPADPEAAFVLHERAAERGDVDSMFELYVLLSTGQGVAKDEVAALAWCRKAAELGQPRARYNMGAFHATGRGVPKDPDEALRWYRLASEAGNGRATAMLGYIFAVGEGTEPDPQRAEAMFALAEEQGFDVEEFREQLGV